MRGYLTLSATDIAYITGVTAQSAYNKYWRGTTEPTLKELRALHLALNISYDELISNIELALAERRKK